MDKEYLGQLIELGYADEAGIAATVVGEDGQMALCVNGEVVSLVSGDPPQKVFKDSIDKLENIVVKSGLFVKSVSFVHGGTQYFLSVKDKNGKTLLDYFKLIG